MEDDLYSLISELKIKNKPENRYLSSTCRVQARIIKIVDFNKDKLMAIHKKFKKLPEPKDEYDTVNLTMLRLNDDFLKLIE